MLPLEEVVVEPPPELEELLAEPLLELEDVLPPPDEELELLEEVVLLPPTLTLNELTAKPCPPCQISEPASTSMRYQELLM